MVFFFLPGTPIVCRLQLLCLSFTSITFRTILLHSLFCFHYFGCFGCFLAFFSVPFKIFHLKILFEHLAIYSLLLAFCCFFLHSVEMSLVISHCICSHVLFISVFSLWISGSSLF
jgi:hypothetical protein